MRVYRIVYCSLFPYVPPGISIYRISYHFKTILLYRYITYRVISTYRGLLTCLTIELLYIVVKLNHISKKNSSLISLKKNSNKKVRLKQHRPLLRLHFVSRNISLYRDTQETIYTSTHCIVATLVPPLSHCYPKLLYVLGVCISV